jgi:hypothetical protein
VLFTVATENTLDKSLRAMKQENLTLFDYLIEKVERKAARRRTVRWIGVSVVLVFTALLAYLAFRYLL